ncbi:hypothetical protein BC830DRAFT_177764 [Chytriomyces sp. MP71]|nr:hypothetical protein BC830DRAFT_177764 [Chytriomyces sp. MP71]
MTFAGIFVLGAAGLVAADTVMDQIAALAVLLGVVVKQVKEQNPQLVMSQQTTTTATMDISSATSLSDASMTSIATSLAMATSLAFLDVDTATAIATQDATGTEMATGTMALTDATTTLFSFSFDPSAISLASFEAVTTTTQDMQSSAASTTTLSPPEPTSAQTTPPPTSSSADAMPAPQTTQSESSLDSNPVPQTTTAPALAPQTQPPPELMTAPQTTAAPAPAPQPQPETTVPPAPAPQPQPQTTVVPAPAPQPQPETTAAPMPAPQTEPPSQPLPPPTTVARNKPKTTTAAPAPAPTQGPPPISNNPCSDITAIVNGYQHGSNSQQDAVNMHNDIRHYVNAYLGMNLPDVRWDAAVAAQATLDAQWSVANADCRGGGLAHWGSFGITDAKNLGWSNYWYAIFQFVTYDNGGGSECQQWFNNRGVESHFSNMMQGGSRMGCGAGTCPGGQFGPVIGCDYAA